MTDQRTCGEDGCDRPFYARDLCEACYARKRRAGTLPKLPKLTDEQRFWAKVNKDGPVPAHRPELGPCWVWTRALKPAGYGAFGTDNNAPQRKLWLTHRYAWTLTRGPIPEGLHLDHICHDPTTCQAGDACPHRACCNPDHLELVTPAENAMRGLVGFIVADERCGRGHVYREDDIDPRTGRRSCSQCKEERRAIVLPPGDSRHRASGYAAYNCRCEICREGHRLRARQYAAKRRQ